MLVKMRIIITYELLKAWTSSLESRAATERVFQRLTGTLFRLFFHLSASLIVHKSAAGARTGYMEERVNSRANPLALQPETEFREVHKLHSYLCRSSNKLWVYGCASSVRLFLFSSAARSSCSRKCRATQGWWMLIAPDTVFF